MRKPNHERLVLEGERNKQAVKHYWGVYNHLCLTNNRLRSPFSKRTFWSIIEQTPDELMDDVALFYYNTLYQGHTYNKKWTK